MTVFTAVLVFSAAPAGRIHFPGMGPTPRMRVAASEADLATVAELAGRIWRAHFPSILSARQIEYMLAWMYDAAQLRAEVARGGTSRMKRGAAGWPAWSWE